MKDTDPDHPDLLRAKALVREALDKMAEVEKRVLLPSPLPKTPLPAFREGGLEVRQRLRQMEIEFDKLHPGGEIEESDEILLDNRE